ncbi:proteasome subunit beta type-2-like [Oppia nitens]|uniref:proteasome subunit beta type-2-like n=1 Tax=Oppia nitens TaxID=1686743 RepID=UPI0023DBC9E8|nr:proteasome subunit beta type-2-like [Oppia nitens]
MEGLIGIRFDNFCLMASDRLAAHSIIVVKSDEKKLYPLSDHLLLGVNGEAGDTVQFAEFIEKNISLYSMRNGFELSPSSANQFIQRNLADYLRSRTPYQVNLLLAGYDTITNKPELYFMDYLATACAVPYGMHGYGSFFGTSILDRNYKSNLTVDEGLELLKKVVHEIQKRLVINLPAFQVAIVDKDGVRQLDDIVFDPNAIGLNKSLQLPVGQQPVPMSH